MLQFKYANNAKPPVRLIEPGMTIGSDRVSGLVVADEGVKGFHADLQISGDSVQIEDVGGGGTWVNGQQIQRVTRIKPGDTIRIGDTELELIDADAEAASGQESGQAGAEDITSDWALRAETGPLQGKLFPIEKDLVVGRAAECGLSIPEGRLSREHARLVLGGNRLVVEDLNSSNGTFHNGERVNSARLEHGDSVSFDTMRFKVIGPANDMDQTIITMAPAQIAATTAGKNAPPEATPQVAPQITVEPERKSGGSGVTLLLGALLAVAAVVAAVVFLGGL